MYFNISIINICNCFKVIYSLLISSLLLSAIHRIYGVNIYNASPLFLISSFAIYYLTNKSFLYTPAFLKKIPFCLFSFFLSCCIILGMYFNGRLYFTRMIFFDFVIFLLICILFTPIIMSIFFNISNMIYKSCDHTLTYKNHFELKGSTVFILIFLCWIPYWLAFFPGLFNYDAWQVNEYIYNNYYTHHPILHSLLLGFFYHSLGAKFGTPNTGIALHAIFQMTIMAMIFSYVFVFLQKWSSNRIVIYAVLLFFCLFPINPILAMSTTKDILFSGFFLLACCLFIKHEKENIKLFYIKILAVFMLLTCFRNNFIHSIFIFIIFLCIAFIILRDKHLKNIVKYGIICILIAKITLSSILFIFHAKENNLKEMLSVSAQQMGRILTYSNNVDLKNRIEHFFDGRHSYREYCADPMKDHFLNINCTKDVFRVLKISAECFFKEPLISIDSFLYTTSGLWDIASTSCANIYSYTGYLYIRVEPGFGVEQKTKLKQFKNFIDMLFTDNLYLSIPIISLLFSCAVPVYFVLFSLVIFYSIRHMYYFMISLFFISYIITISFGPTIIIRYIYPIYICIPLIIFMINDSISDFIVKTKIQSV